MTHNECETVRLLHHCGDQTIAMFGKAIPA
jgi:hypothetical protein